MWRLFFRLVTPCRLPGRYQCFGKYNVSIFRADAICFPETLVSTYESTRHQKTEDQSHLYCRENIKSHIIKFVSVRGGGDLPVSRLQNVSAQSRGHLVIRVKWQELLGPYEEHLYCCISQYGTDSRKVCVRSQGSVLSYKYYYIILGTNASFHKL
jgi:hypothetical protein